MTLSPVQMLGPALGWGLGAGARGARAHEPVGTPSCFTWPSGSYTTIWCGAWWWS